MARVYFVQWMKYTSLPVIPLKFLEASMIRAYLRSCEQKWFDNSTNWQMTPRNCLYVIRLLVCVLFIKTRHIRHQNRISLFIIITKSQDWKINHEFYLYLIYRKIFLFILTIILKLFQCSKLLQIFYNTIRIRFSTM